MRHLNQRGLTLIEVVMTMVIAVFLAMTAVPFINDYLANSRLREGGHLLFAEAMAAQSEALKRNTNVRLEASGTTLRVIDRTDVSNPVTLRERSFVGGVASEVKNLDFSASGLPSPFGTAVSIDLSMSGVTCSSDYRCPGLRVDGGGAMRLCNDITGSC